MLGGETATQRLIMAEDLPADQSKIIYQFPDGWSIRQFITIGDLHREGCLMGNCLERSYEIEKGTFNSSEPISLDDGFSLRDPQNLPHATLINYDFMNEAVLDRAYLEGRHGSIPKPEYIKRFIDAGFAPSSLRIWDRKSEHGWDNKIPVEGVDY